MTTDTDAARARYDKALATARASVADMPAETLAEQLARLQVEYSRLNDRHLAMLHDQAEDRRRMQASTLATHRRAVGRAVHFEVSKRVGRLNPAHLLPLLERLDVARPKAADLRAARTALSFWTADLRRYLTPVEPIIGAAQASALDYLRSTYHDHVLAWQDMGGPATDDLGAWDHRGEAGAA